MIERPQTSWIGASLALLLSAAFVLLVLLPLIQLLAGPLLADSAGLETTRGTLRDHRLQHAFIHTLAVAALACGLASVVAIPAAFVAVRMGNPVRLLVQVLGILPLTMPPFLTAAVFEHLGNSLGQAGAMQTSAGSGPQHGDVALIAVFALHYLPFILFSLIAGLRHIDRSLAETALTLGSGRLRAWRRITLPLLTPAFGFGVTLVILRILEDVGTPLVLGIDSMLAPQLLTRLGSGGLSDPLLNASALALLMASVVVTAMAWSYLVKIPLPCAPAPCVRPARWRGGAVTLLIGLPIILVLVVLALAPHVWLIVMSLGADGWAGMLPPVTGSNQLLQLLRETLIRLDVTPAYVAGAGFLTLIIGSGFAVLTLRSGPGGRLAGFLSTSMFAIPGVVLALAYLLVLDTWDLQPGSALSPGWLALMLVVALKQSPLAARVVAYPLHSLQQRSAPAVALSLGAGRLRIALQYGLRILPGALVMAFLLGGVAAVVELSAALVLIQDPQAPLALDLYRALQTPAESTGAPVQGLLLVALTASLYALLFWSLHRYCRRATTAPPGLTDATRNLP